MTTNYQQALDDLHDAFNYRDGIEVGTDEEMCRVADNMEQRAITHGLLAVADALTRQTEEVLQPAGFAVLDEWETPEGELFDWPSAIIEALGEFHDEEMCDGPEDLIKEIEVVRLLGQQYYKALVALEASSNRIINQALQGDPA